MSYCRWSSDWFRCDLYCYGDVAGGYTTHVAGNRTDHEVPEDWGNDSRVSVDDWMARHTEISNRMKLAKRVPIGLSRDGETFSDPDLASFLARVVSLKDEGYRVPDYVLDEIREEIAKETP